METKKQGKITVRHYLNTNLKPYKIDEDKLYKVYFLMRYKNKNTRTKSLIDEELTEKDYNLRINDPNDILSIRINNEKKLVERVIGITDKMNLPFEIKLFRDVWDMSVYPIIEKFEKYIDWQSSRIDDFKDLPTFHSTQHSFEHSNLIAYYNVLNSLKLFVSNSKHSITDELFLFQLYDSEVIRDYQKGLSKDEQSQRIFTPENKENGNIIQTTYKDEMIDNIQLLKDCIFRDNRYPYFFQHPKITRAGIFEIDKYYFQEILGYIIDS